MGNREQYDHRNRTRFAREGGWCGRRRNYVCRVCGEKFQHDGNRLPVKSRVCYNCRQTNEGLQLYNQSFIEQHKQEIAQGLIP